MKDPRTKIREALPKAIDEANKAQREMVERNKPNMKEEALEILEELLAEERIEERRNAWLTGGVGGTHDDSAVAVVELPPTRLQTLKKLIKDLND